ncbi:MAG: hypothetical protein QOI58_2626, partial [Thermoanaerobaculia bacterium]|nr:hypothetical protein [Thermoanaerobaculia bacterium]
MWRIGTSKNPKRQCGHVHFDVQRLVDVTYQKRTETEFARAVTQRLVLRREGSSQNIAVNENELAWILLPQFVAVVSKVLTFLLQ